jgi:iron complex transport system substrate-binding protein
VEILQMIMTLGRLIGAEAKAERLIDEMLLAMEGIRLSASGFPHRPRVFFEEWYDPLISGIRWVEELIEIAGGVTLFPELRHCKNAPDRILKPEDVAARDPQVVIASWCGRMVQKKKIRERAGWEQVEAVRLGHLYEIKSTYILQPGPASLTEGLRQLHAILGMVAGAEIDPRLAPQEKVDQELGTHSSYVRAS